MTITMPESSGRPISSGIALFAGAIFSSAALVFALEPMIAKMILPLLGGSPSVWNTSMMFFQAALLAGYAYAHLLQRVLPLRAQLLLHLAVLAAAMLSLPVTVAGASAPPVEGPIWWLLGVLAVSIGAPFTALSATTPLLQAWYVKMNRGSVANPYVLYGASNLGSMLALLAYPALAEPLLPLSHQSIDWSWAYRLFFLLALAIAVMVWRSGVIAPPVRHTVHTKVSLRRRVTWVLLAAGPSSLMLGTTTFIANDVASVPLFWVIPLALYLLTFVIAFQNKPLIPAAMALRWQVLFTALAAGLLCITSAGLPLHLFDYLGVLFFSALVCHHALAADRPHEDHLTEFYLLISFGGVLGGVFNSLLAPVIFSNVVEFPLMLALVCLARPWGTGRPTNREILFTAIGIAAALIVGSLPEMDELLRQRLTLGLVILSGVCAALVHGRALLFAAVIGALALQWSHVADNARTNLLTARSFFGVSRLTVESRGTMGGGLHVLYHGTTVHGAQATNPAFRCQPTTYYAPGGPIGQTFRALQNANPALTIGVVGLGAGTLASYTRGPDHLRYFEIDPEVARIARNRNYFTFLSDCAKGKLDIVLGDARLTFAREAAASYDLITLDAFSADNIPTHLLTREAFALYFRALKPDGVILLHISNRNLALDAPGAATARAAGAGVLVQTYSPDAKVDGLEDAASQVLLLSKSPAALAAFRRNGAWRDPDTRGVRPWSDDYTNVMGALIDRVVRHH